MPKFKFIGIVMLAFLVFVALFQMQTTEAFITHTTFTNVFQPNLAVLIQPIQLLSGQLSLQQGEAVFVGWTIEIIYIASALEHNRWSAAVKAGNARMATLFELGILATTAFNAWTDYNYFDGDMMTKTIISILIFFVSYYFGHALNLFSKEARA